jgi:hypothetical protein
MLARRFVLVCLMAALFGLSLATLVADPGRGRRTDAQAGILPVAASKKPPTGW